MPFLDLDRFLCNLVHSTNLGEDIPCSTDRILRDNTHNTLVGGDIPTRNTNTGRDIPLHSTNLADDGKGKRAATVDAHLDEEGGDTSKRISQ